MSNNICSRAVSTGLLLLINILLQCVTWSADIIYPSGKLAGLVEGNRYTSVHGYISFNFPDIFATEKLFIKEHNLNTVANRTVVNVGVARKNQMIVTVQVASRDEYYIEREAGRFQLFDMDSNINLDRSDVKLFLSTVLQSTANHGVERRIITINNFKHRQREVVYAVISHVARKDNTEIKDRYHILYLFAEKKHGVLLWLQWPLDWIEEEGDFELQLKERRVAKIDSLFTSLIINH